MKIIKIKTKLPYAVTYSSWNTVNKQHMAFKTILEACDFSLTQGEYIDSCPQDVIAWVEKNKHPIQYKGGFQEFCV